MTPSRDPSSFSRLGDGLRKGATDPTNHQAPSFDDLIGAGDDLRRHRDAKGLGGLEVEGQFDFHGLLDREIGGVFALQNPARIKTDNACASIMSVP